MNDEIFWTRDESLGVDKAMIIHPDIVYFLMRYDNGTIKYSTMDNITFNQTQYMPCELPFQHEESKPNIMFTDRYSYPHHDTNAKIMDEIINAAIT